MKKITKLTIGIILILSMILAICPKIYANMTPTLQSVANIFNACAEVKNNTIMNLSATATEGTLTVIVEKDEIQTTLIYQIEDAGILVANYTGGDLEKKKYYSEVTKIVIDCIGQYHGYQDGEMLKTLRSSEIEDYNLEEHGLEIKEKSDNVYLAHINLSKIVPTLNTAKYIKEADLESQKEEIIGDGETVPAIKVGNAIFYKKTVDNLDYLVVAEKEKFSYVIERSLKSVLNVFFTSKAERDYFEENYSGIAAGNKRFAGVKVEINPIKTDDEVNVLGTDNIYKFIRITVDREAIKEALEEQSEENTESESSTTSEKSSTSTSTNPQSDTLPKTGGEINKGLIALYAIMGTAGVGIIILSANSKKQN